MTSADYDYEYFRNLLLQKKNFEYEKYKDYEVRDLMIDCLNDETIYDYSLLDGNMFYYYFFYPNRSEAWDERMCPGQPFDDFSNLFKSLELRLKVLLFIQQIAEEIWPHTNYSLIQDECARIICGILNELETSDYQDMPKPDFKNLIRDPEFLTEKTPSKRWCEEHNLDTNAIPAIKSPNQDDVEDAHSSSGKLEKIASTLTPIEDVFKIEKPSKNITINIGQFNMGNGTQSGVLPEKQQ